MMAKRETEPHRNDTRPDWDYVRVKVMRWALRIKLAQNFRAFFQLLMSTGEQPIVEESQKDGFWGARAVGEERLVGINVLGRLLMELRDRVTGEDRTGLFMVPPLAIPDFLLYGKPIEAVQSAEGAVADAAELVCGADLAVPKRRQMSGGS